MKKTKFELAANSCSTIQNINSWSFWIWKKSSLFNLINHESDLDKIYFSAKDPYEVKHQFNEKTKK